MTSFSERKKVLLSLPVDKHTREWLRAESKKTRLPMGTIVGRLVADRLERSRAQFDCGCVICVNRRLSETVDRP